LSNLPGIAYRCRNDRDWTMEFLSDGCLDLTGYWPSDLLYNRTLSYAQLILPEDRGDVWNDVQAAVSKKMAFELVYRIKTADDEVKWVWEQGRGVFSDTGELLALEGFITDVTEQKQAEEGLRRANRALRTRTACNRAVVHATGESRLLDEVCQAIVQVGGYRLAWVGFAGHDEEKSVRPVAQAGYEEGYLGTVNITWADAERGRGPTGKAIRTGQPAIVRNMLTDPDYEPWRAEATKRGYAASIALPLVSQGRVLGALNIYAAEPDAFDEEEVELLTALASDLAYSIVSLRTQR
jgi:putative methionine-R-sulfoxide reductase with GAF domain